MAAPEQAPSSGVASVSKAVSLLRMFTPSASVLSIRQLADRTGIPRSTVHALCATLSAEGLLELVPQAGYRLGPTLLELGGQIVERAGLVEAAEPVMGRLPRIRGMEAHLGQLVGGWVVYLHHRSFDSMRVPMANWVGLRAPAFLTGCGKATLSLLEPKDVEARMRSLSRSEQVRPPDASTLRDELTAAREQGFVVSRTFQQDRTSVAAPVVGPDGVPVGGLSVAGPSSLFTPRLTEQAAHDVKEAARQTGARLLGERAAYVRARPIRW
ncbi:IclR family transcriptional regulator [Pseudonocardia sp. T1-2H]|uniref:IclR family transcriptional regulator n=1 Tax=Pseudonocardia sp. T1-2H TaxID=3128899 RepID=UPI00310114DB